ncbi:hypothetical protein ACQKL5_01605 [Peribacillus sp. NPDC097675]|uniref:hypothetical protein n=1 Tax=Peribacillus sp. NPDC097675 TaxID=3390618 RepID=UPI003D00D657
MGDLIQFFLNNPYLLIILIGVATSMLGRKKKQSQQNNPNTPPKKRWQDVMQELQGEVPQKEQRKTPMSASGNIDEKHVVQTAEIVDETKAQAEKRIAELRRLQQKYEQERVEQKEKADQITSNLSDNGSPVYHKGPSFNKKQLIDGIIMSEVLGPPRAKRSLQRSRR